MDLALVSVMPKVIYLKAGKFIRKIYLNIKNKMRRPT